MDFAAFGAEGSLQLVANRGDWGNRGVRDTALLHDRCLRDCKSQSSSAQSIHVGPQTRPECHAIEMVPQPYRRLFVMSIIKLLTFPCRSKIKHLTHADS